MKYCLRGILTVLALALANTTSAAGPKNIFDDDWTPPTLSESPHPARATPATLPAVDSPHPVDPPNVTTTMPTSTSSSPEVRRRIVPAKAEQAAARKVLKEVFAEQLIDRSIPARRKLTEALLGQADKSVDAPVDQFVLLAAAIDAGTDAVDLPLVFQAGDRMAKVFDVDGLAIKAESATKLTTKPGSSELASENVRAGLHLVNQLADAEHFVAANHVCAVLVPLATTDRILLAEVMNRQQDVNASRTASEKVAKHFDKLKTSPNDAIANLEVGKYLCFYKNDWKSGLPALARGGDVALKSLATKEISGAETPDAQALLGDAWWDIAQKSVGPSKASAQSHAVFWYNKAVGGLNGLSKAKVEKRLALSAASTTVRIPAESWTILFRSPDPTIWNTEAKRNANDFTLKLTAVAKDVKWLRLSCGANGKSVVIPITYEALSKQSLVSEEYGWEGTATLALGASHLGIWSEKLSLDRSGMVAVGRAGHDRRGWGFGRHHQTDKDQGLSWEGEEIKGPVVFEIAVKGGTLSDAEQKVLLTAP